MKIKANYPCCKGVAIFNLVDGLRGMRQLVMRRCPKCKILWQVDQQMLANKNGVRIDRLDWRKEQITHTFYGK